MNKRQRKKMEKRKEDRAIIRAIRVLLMWDFLERTGGGK